MTISSHFYEAYLKCPTKCFLRALGEMGTGNAYADWVRTQNASYRTEESQRLRQRATRDQCVIGPPAAANLKSAKWNLAIDLTVRTDHLQSTIHAVERVVSQERGKPTQLIPIPIHLRRQTHQGGQAAGSVRRTCLVGNTGDAKSAWGRLSTETSLPHLR